MNELIKLYEDYIKLLGEELNETARMASIHGWESERFEQGEEMRKKILRKRFEFEQNSANFNEFFEDIKL